MSPIPVDPYKYLLYKIMAKSVDDIQLPPSIASSLVGGSVGWEDGVWIQLCLIHGKSILGSRTLSL